MNRRIILIVAILFFLTAMATTFFAISKLVGASESRSCSYNGTVYKNGESLNDGCNSCVCNNGEVSCTDMACEEDVPILEDEDTTTSSCLYRGEIYEDGQSFDSPDDTCNTCSCEDGDIICTAIACFEN